MTKSRKKMYVLSSAVLAAIGSHSALAGTPITQWNFSGATVGTVTSSPAPSTGTGTATSLGMTNGYTYASGEGPGAVDGSNITNVAGSLLPAENTWKIVGNSNTKNAGAGFADGWNNSAPNYTQGAEFQVSTVGYTNIGLSFDWFATNKGVANLQVRYTTDGSTWNNLGNDLIATPNDFFGAAASTPSVSLDLSSITAANNNPSFAVELVSVRPVAGDANFQAAGPGGDGNYASATPAVGAAGDYNNSSGNWSFDNITVSGTVAAVPEPASAGVLGLSGLAILARRRNKSDR